MDECIQASVWVSTIFVYGERGRGERGERERERHFKFWYEQQKRA